MMLLAGTGYNPLLQCRSICQNSFATKRCGRVWASHPPRRPSRPNGCPPPSRACCHRRWSSTWLPAADIGALPSCLGRVSESVAHSYERHHNVFRRVPEQTGQENIGGFGNEPSSVWKLRAKRSSGRAWNKTSAIQACQSGRPSKLIRTIHLPLKDTLHLL